MSPDVNTILAGGIAPPIWCTSPAMEAGEKIAELRGRRGWSRPELARRMATTPQQLERLEKGQRRLTMDWLQRAAVALETDVTTLVADADLSAVAAGAPNATPFKYEGASSQRMAENLPIYGTAIGTERLFDGDAVEQTMLNSGDTVGYLKRPTMLNGRGDVYGLYVQGSSMDPVFCEGATIVAETKRPPRIGDDVVVYLRPDDHNEDDGLRSRAVLVKRLVRRSGTWIELQQFSPALTFKIETADIVRVDRVMTLGDLLG